MSKVRDFNLFSDIFILNFILLQNMFILKKISNIFKLKFIINKIKNFKIYLTLNNKIINYKFLFNSIYLIIFFIKINF